MTTRAKFQCNTETTKRWGKDPATSRVYDFTAVYDAESPEDQRFAKATPSGSLSITVDNPAVTFEPGKAYYLDITPVDSASS